MDINKILRLFTLALRGYWNKYYIHNVPDGLELYEGPTSGDYKYFIHIFPSFLMNGTYFIQILDSHNRILSDTIRFEINNGNIEFIEEIEKPL